jgi:glycosyltransferase involved in cell wall biosynthesis
MDSSRQPLVSIVIPSYNYGTFLANTIQSVLGQTYKNLELIIVDNASTDNSLEISRGFASDPRVKILQIEVNNGPVPAWNLGFEHVRGEWFAMLPADDYFEASKIEKQIEYIRLHPEVTMLSTYVQQVDENGSPSKNPWIEPVVNLQADFKNPDLWDWEHHFCIPSAIYRTDLCRLVGTLSGGLHSVVDIEFHVRLLRKGGVAQVLPEKLTNYRWHGLNQSGKKNQNTAHQWVYYQITQFMPYADEKGLLSVELETRSLKKFLSQFYVQECSVREVAAFLECFSSWRDFSRRFASYYEFCVFVEQYTLIPGTAAPTMLVLAERALAAENALPTEEALVHRSEPKISKRPFIKFFGALVLYRPSIQFGRKLRLSLGHLAKSFRRGKVKQDGP